MTKILIADGLAKEGLEKIKKISDVEVMDYAAIDREELKKLLPEAHVLIVRSRTQVDRDLLEYAKNLNVVLRAGIGLDNVDMAAATDRGVIVMNAPTGNIVTTAEHAIAMMFSMTRNIPQAHYYMKQGKWEKKKFQGHELRNKTLGLIGLGNIGKVVASRARALEMKVVAFDPYISSQLASQFQVELKTFDEVLAAADYVSIHVPATEGTKNLFNEETFSKMKKGSYLINCARGGIVNEQALCAALDKKQLAGAALDVFEMEPLPANHFLISREDVILTPHLGASTDEAQVQVGLEVAEQLENFIKHGIVKNAFNVPNLSLTELQSVKPFMSLCEKLGSFVSQMNTSTHIDKIKVSYFGMQKAKELEALTLSVLKGYLTPLVSSDVNFVSAKNLIKNKGINVEESFNDTCEDYHQLIEVSIIGNNPFSVTGTLFGKKEPRLVKINDFEIDAELTGHMLFIKNQDTPGVVGAIGSELGNSKVNIGHFHLGRKSHQNEAISLINIDSDIKTDTLERLKNIPSILMSKKLYFDEGFK
jgi:D-3-phosphoglycerate dehydrogenase